MRSLRAVQHIPEITEHLVTIGELELEKIKGVHVLSYPMTHHPESNSVSMDFVNGVPTTPGNNMPDFRQLTGLERIHNSYIVGGNAEGMIRSEMDSSIAALARYAEFDTEGLSIKQRRKLGGAVVTLTSYAVEDSAKLGPASYFHGHIFVDRHSPAEHIAEQEEHYVALMPFVWHSTKRWVSQFI